MYAKPLKVEGNGVIRARTKQGNVWSAMTEAVFENEAGGGIIVSVPELPFEPAVRVYPNPFRESARIEFQLREPCVIKAAIYDADGRLVKILSGDIRIPGIHSLTWNASGQPGGIYFYRIQFGQSIHSGKLILIN